MLPPHLFQKRPFLEQSEKGRRKPSKRPAFLYQNRSVNQQAKTISPD